MVSLAALTWQGSCPGVGIGPQPRMVGLFGLLLSAAGKELVCDVYGEVVGEDSSI